MFHLYAIDASLSKGGSSTGVPSAPPPCLNFLGVCLCITRICFNCSHHAMFTIYTLICTLTTKHKVCVKGIKTNLRPQEVNRTGTGPPGFEIPGSASAKDIIPVMPEIKCQNLVKMPGIIRILNFETFNHNPVEANWMKVERWCVRKDSPGYCS